MPLPPACHHERLHLDVSDVADEVGFVRLPLQRRLAATTPSGRVIKARQNDPEDISAFPGPLVLPEDELAWDPKHPPQSLRSWIQEKERNPVTQDRKTIYVGYVPQIEADISIMKRWTTPTASSLHPKHAATTVPPRSLDGEHVREYLEAFYHGLPVKPLKKQFSFVSWNKVKPGQVPDHVGLRMGSSCVQIRTRPSPDKVFPRQLNLNDILDAMIEALPEDAYSVLLLLDHDLYEDDDDDFCCGRAYGGSRVAVVSAARYHPVLDATEDLDHAHMWPASHCHDYVDKQMGMETRRQVPRATAQTGPIGAAIQAALTTPSWDTELYGLWLSRVARTASHELGHCLALDHCVYYACVMQGAASLAEDVRQPPYLCPVCTSKVCRAISSLDENASANESLKEGYRILANYCHKWNRIAMFAGFGAWLNAMLESGVAT